MCYVIKALTPYRHMNIPLRPLTLCASLTLASCQLIPKKSDVPEHEQGTVTRTTLSSSAMKHLPKELITEAPSKEKPSHKQFITKPTYIAGNELWENHTLTVRKDVPKRLEIHTRTQRGLLFVGDAVAMDFPLTTGKAGKRTPKGTFKVSEKKVDKSSTLYGSFVNSKNSIVRGGVRVTDRRPKGTRFRGAKMPYWMRINGPVGIHQGSVHRFPASNGCIRLPREVAPLLFKQLKSGSKVTVL